MVIPADAASGSSTLVITPVDDQVVEGDETILVTGALGDGTASTAVITLQQAANSPPAFDDGAGPLTRSVAENSPADTAVGSAVAATDPDGDTLAYTLTGADASSFTVDGSGQIKIGQGTSLDYETTTSYSVTVNVSDGKDATGGQDTAIDASVNVTINVTDVLDSPTGPRFFPFTISRMVLDRPGDIGDVALPQAEGGEGEFTYTLTGLPQGLSFDPETRTLSGIVAAGVYTLTYTATDEAGVQDPQTFTLTVGATLSGAQSGVRAQSRGVQGQSEDIDWRRPHVRNMAVDRKQYSEPSAPGFTVTWNAPDMSRDSSGDNLTLADIAQYEFRYGKRRPRPYHVRRCIQRLAQRGADRPGGRHGSYGVHLRVEYSGERFTEWSFANAQGRTHHQQAAEAGGGQPQSNLHSPVGWKRLRSKDRRRFHGPQRRPADLYGLIHACRHRHGHD